MTHKTIFFRGKFAFSFYTICFLTFAFFFISDAQPIQLKWTSIQEINLENQAKEKHLYFENAYLERIEGLFIPVFSKTYKQFDANKTTARLKNLSVTEISPEELLLFGNNFAFKNSFVIESSVLSEKKQKQLFVKILPFRKNESGKIEKLLSFEIEFLTTTLSKNRFSTAMDFASNSVMNSGTWFRIGVTKEGIYKMDRNFFQSLGADVQTLNPQYIRIFGNGGKQLSFKNSDFRYDDLVENAIVVEGEQDGKFDETDYVWFFGQSPHKWIADSSCGGYSHRLHQYSDTTYYFINIDGEPGKRMLQQQNLILNPTTEVNTFDEYQFYENEAVNLLISGREWLGEKFDNQLSYNYDFNFPNISLSDSVYIKSRVLARSGHSLGAGGIPSVFTFNCQGKTASVSPRAINPLNYTSDFARFDSLCFGFLPNASNLNVRVNFTKSSQFTSAIGWMDYIEIIGRRQLRLFGNSVIFEDKKSVGSGQISRFRIGDATQQTKVIEITNPLEPLIQSAELNGNVLTFTQNTDVLKRFIAFNIGSNAMTVPVSYGRVPNQNLHAFEQTDLIIVYHPIFESQAQRLKSVRETNDGLRAIMVTPQQIYNEFSSGSQDITAIKHFCKMFYDRASSTSDMPKYLLLFGDASYNNRSRNISNNTNFIPCYQSLNSMDLITSYVSDDYFGFLDNDESDGITDLMDLGVGRLPVKTLEEAKNVVDKLIEYGTKSTINDVSDINSCSDASSAQSGDWKNVICFVADDQDRNIHIRDADKIATFVDTSYQRFNIDKIYFDSFKQVTNAGGQRFPEVKNAINRRMDNGALMVNYTGHGGETGWALERVLEVVDIKSWKNKGRYPFFVTATCEFSRFDDPLRTSGGEYVILQPNGGGIGLLTTTRLVYSSPNFTLNMEYFKEVFKKDDNGNYLRMGDVSMQTKNASVRTLSNNHRNFSLLGDPSMRLAFPKENVVTSKIEVIPGNGVSDTLKALSKVKVTGYVSDRNGQKINNFNGIIYPSVFDKQAVITSLANDSLGSDISFPFVFNVFKNIVYRGKVSVVNGDFSFEFIVPKDIDYNIGNGRISYYALNNNTDANGYTQNFLIGGINKNAPEDRQGPEIKLFMNDETFIQGSMTDENPKILSFLKDDNGINTVGSGIGHDIVAVLDENTSQSIVLNDYYQSELNSYQSGVIRYPFNNLSEGTHTLSLRAWDVYNNSSTAKTEFVVAKSASIALDKVMNYPNPFTTRTRFMFEHNKPCEPLDVQVQIFTVSGKLVKTLETVILCEGYRSDKLEWDGLDDYGDKIGKGVYVYKLKVSAKDGSSAEKFEKLVLLN